MLYVYLLIIVFLIGFILINLFEEETLYGQLDAALVLVPLILRLFLIK